jgi:hypothetical protein
MDCTRKWGYTFIGGKLRDINNRQFDSGHFNPGTFCFNLIRPGCHIITSIILPANGIPNRP